jgi:hypothetical protein
MRVQLIIALFIGFYSVQLSAQDHYTAVIDSFFVLYGKGGTDASIEYVFSTNPYLFEAKQQKQSIQNKLKTVSSLIGNYYGYEIVTVNEKGESYVLIKCMVKHDRQPLFFTFVFYKPQQQWRLISLKFDDQFEFDGE